MFKGEGTGNNLEGEKGRERSGRRDGAVKKGTGRRDGQELEGEKGQERKGAVKKRKGRRFGK